jgi:hypothetical protein
MRAQPPGVGRAGQRKTEEERRKRPRAGGKRPERKGVGEGGREGGREGRRKGVYMHVERGVKRGSVQGGGKLGREGDREGEGNEWGELKIAAFPFPGHK